MDYQARLKKLREKMAQAGWPALLVTHLADVRYLSGFTGSNAALAVTAGSAALLTDGRYSTQAQEEVTLGRRAMRVIITKTVVAEACRLLHKQGAHRIVYDPVHTSVAALETMQNAVAQRPGKIGRRYFSPAQPFPVAALREVKDADELLQMQEAATLGCRLFEAILPKLKPGVAEREIAAELEFLARSLGADGMSFETIVASGPRSALPHGTASDRPLPARGFVTLDFGVIVRGYCSDMTRTVYLGRPSREEASAYRAVLAAQQAGLAAVQAGAAAGEVDRAARRWLRQAGLARYFTHSTGHGVGIEIHEGPRLAAKQEQVLATGMVLTVEPGIYLPGHFGIRIEDMIAITDAGGHILTAEAPKTLLQL